MLAPSQPQKKIFLIPKMFCQKNPKIFSQKYFCKKIRRPCLRIRDKGRGKAPLPWVVDILPFSAWGRGKNKDFLVILRKNNGKFNAREQNFHYII